MAVKSDREYRDMAMEVRTAENEEAPEERKVVTGYASTFNEPYTLYENDDWRFNEVVDARAFDNTDMSDVIMQYDHCGRVFARNRNNTLTLLPDGDGLKITARLGGTEIGRQLYEEIKGGYTDKMSFAFVVDSDERSEKTEAGKTIVTRRITGIRKLYDVSAVSMPANDTTSISARSWCDGEIARLEAERLSALDIAKRKLALKIRLQEEIKK